MKTLTGIRPSLGARCATAAVFQGRGEIPADAPPEVEEWQYRGQWMEQMVVSRLRAKHGHGNVKQQVVVPIEGIGEGHIDAVVNGTLAVEIVSTTSPVPNAPIFDYKLAQLRIYMHFGGYDEGAILAIDPSRFQPEQTFAVRLTDEDHAGIEAWREYIVRAVNGGELDLDPRGSDYRPCTRPSQARSRMCPFAHACFGEDWQPPEPTEVTDPHVLELVSRLAGLKSEKQKHTSAAKVLELGEKEIQAELAGLIEPGDAQVGPFKVRRTHVVMQPKFSVKAYEAAGHSLEPLAEFFAGGSEHDRWSVSRNGDGEVDYGDAPF